jgi:phage gpG-like protein
MPLRLTIETLGEAAVDRTLSRFEGNLDDLTPAWEDIDQTLINASVKQFRSQGAYGSGGWTPLAPSTLAKKARLGQDHRILQATRRLKNSLTRRESSEHLLITTPQDMHWGTTVPYARIHQDGAANLPQRRVVQLPEGGRREVVRVLQRHIVQGVGVPA